MKKIIAMLLLLCVACALLMGCAGGGEIADSSNTAGSDTGSAGAADPSADGGDSGDGIDVDLSETSSTLTYAQVVQILENPKYYLGKTIRIVGQYFASYFEETDKYYHFVVVGDVSLCCQQGVEFVWSGKHKYPDDYPEEKALIEVTGVFGSYEELGITYYYLAVDEIKILG